MTRHHRKIKKSRRMRGGIIPLLYRAYSSATKKNQPLPTTPPTTPPPTTPTTGTTSSSWFGSSTPSTSSSSSWFGSSTPSTSTTGVAAGTGTGSTSSSWFGSSTPSTSSSSSWFGSSTPTTSTTTSTTTGTGNSWFGGKRRRGKHTHRRHKRGGTPGWTPLTGIAAHGAPFSGETAKPQVWVGGKTKRRYRKKGTRRH